MNVINLTSGYYNNINTNISFSYIKFQLNANEYLQLEMYTSISKVSLIYNNRGTNTVIWEIIP